MEAHPFSTMREDHTPQYVHNLLHHHKSGKCNEGNGHLRNVGGGGQGVKKLRQIERLEQRRRSTNQPTHRSYYYPPHDGSCDVEQFTVKADVDELSLGLICLDVGSRSVEGNCNVNV